MMCDAGSGIDNSGNRLIDDRTTGRTGRRTGYEARSAAAARAVRILSEALKFDKVFEIFNHR